MLDVVNCRGSSFRQHTYYTPVLGNCKSGRRFFSQKSPPSDRKHSTTLRHSMPQSDDDENTKSGYGIPSAIPTTLQAVAVFALGDASENKLNPVTVLPFMAFHGNASGQVNACAAVHKTATIAASGILLLKPLARLLITTKSFNRGNSIPFYKNSHNHSVSPCLRQFKKTLWQSLCCGWFVVENSIFRQHQYYTPHFRNCKPGRTFF